MFRFAPSPNGRLHLGHALSALLNAHLAVLSGGRFLVRIDDIDTARCRPEYEAAILDDLAWLGLDVEMPVRRQSDHLAEYANSFANLRERGLVYPCFCTRADLARPSEWTREPRRRDPDGSVLYDGRCRHLTVGETEARLRAGCSHAWRLAQDRAAAALRRSGTGPLAYVSFVPDGTCETVPADAARWGDVVLVRKDVCTSYHLSVVVDDAAQGVTHVVRGADLEPATDLHVLLQTLLRLATPLYHHHPLVRDPKGRKLAKSLGSPSLSDLRGSGWSPADIRSRLGFA